MLGILNGMKRTLSHVFMRQTVTPHNTLYEARTARPEPRAHPLLL